MASQTTTPIETCSRCGGTRFGFFAGPSGRRRRCRDCANPQSLDAALDQATAHFKATGRTSDGLTGDDVFALIARNTMKWTS